MKKVLVTVLVLLVLGVAGWLLFMNDDDADKATPAPVSTTETTESNQDTSAADSEVATITYTDNGFDPQSLTVKAGTELTIVNNSSDDLQFSSDPHPVHTDNSELNLSTLAPGESQTLVVSVKGTHGIHNHLNDSDSMTLIVE